MKKKIKKAESDGAICGGSRESAEKIVKRDGHCGKHKKRKRGCSACMDKYLELIDVNFMALM